VAAIRSTRRSPGKGGKGGKKKKGEKIGPDRPRLGATSPFWVKKEKGGRKGKKKKAFFFLDTGLPIGLQVEGKAKGGKERKKRKKREEAPPCSMNRFW